MQVFPFRRRAAFIGVRRTLAQGLSMTCRMLRLGTFQRLRPCASHGHLLLAGLEGPVKAQDHALRAYARQRSLRQHVPIPVRPRSEANTPDRSGGLASISSGKCSPLP